MNENTTLAERYPALCFACRTRSAPRPLGRTPEGWFRDMGSHDGHYYCPDCELHPTRIGVSDDAALE